MFQRVFLEPTLSSNSFADVEPAQGLRTLEANEFFLREDGSEATYGALPLPRGMPMWKHARYREGDVLITGAGEDLYLIADTTKFGFAMFHYQLRPDLGEGVYRPSFQDSCRAIKSTKEEISMNQLTNLANRAVGMAPTMAPMDLSASTPTAGQGISNQQTLSQIRNEARIKAYVFGYVVNSAPAVTVDLKSTTAGSDDKATKTYVIQAKESRPSKVMAVLMAMPKRCVCRQGQMTTPGDIMNGLVDFETADKNAMYLHAFSLNSAISYVTALGNKIPEYAPNVVDGQRNQWSAEDLLSGKPECTYVFAEASKSSAKNRVAGSGIESFKFNLKSSSSRRSLFTRNNIMCLRGLEHINTKIKNDNDMRAVNDSAFGRWQLTNMKDSQDTKFQVAQSHNPNVLWTRDYTTEDGSTVKGIASAFFMNGDSDKTEDGTTVAKRDLLFYPWYVTAAQKKGSDTVKAVEASQVTRIVKRELGTTKAGKPTMKTTPVRWADNPDHPIFQPYARFANAVIQLGYLTSEALKAMGSRSTGNKKDKQYVMSQETLASFQMWMSDAKVQEEIQADLDKASIEATLAANR